MPRFFPSAQRVAEARQHLAGGHYGDLDETMGVSSLERPRTRDLPELIAEFCAVVDELDLRDADSSGFVVLVPVTVNGASLTTPVLVDVQRNELAFTSHPDLGAGTVPDRVLTENPDLPARVREQLLGVLATWHNTAVAEDET
jgi:hypothetical protein